MPANYRYHKQKSSLCHWSHLRSTRHFLVLIVRPVSISAHNGPWYYPLRLLDGTYLAGSILWSLREIGFTGARPLHSGWCKGRPGSLCGWRTAQFLAPASLMLIKIKTSHFININRVVMQIANFAPTRNLIWACEGSNTDTTVLTGT